MLKVFLSPYIGLPNIYLCRVSYAPATQWNSPTLSLLIECLLEAPIQNELAGEMHATPQSAETAYM